jgi:single-strand DNA-binding protein
MAVSLNKVMLIGNIGKDPEVRYLDKNMVVAEFSLATSERGYTLQNGTSVPEHTEWHKIVTWGNLAKYAETYIKKGCKVYVEGKIRTRSYEDKKGLTHNVIEILADKLEIFSFPQKTDESQPTTV